MTGAAGGPNTAATRDTALTQDMAVTRDTAVTAGSADAAVGGGADGATVAGAPRWARVLIAVGLAVSLVLSGAAADRLLGRPKTRSGAGRRFGRCGFAQDMSVRHDNAVQMATWVREHSSDPVIRQLAYDIESGQTAQVGQMQGWLALWGASPQPVGGYMRWMPHEGTGASMGAGMGTGHTGGGHTGAGVAAMPGMASQDDLARLRSATGPAVDVLFLQLMVHHHDGGAPMLRYAAQHAERPPVRNLAGQMLTAQSAETDLMRQMLAERGAKPTG